MQFSWVSDALKLSGSI